MQIGHRNHSIVISIDVTNKLFYIVAKEVTDKTKNFKGQGYEKNKQQYKIQY